MKGWIVSLESNRKVWDVKTRNYCKPASPTVSGGCATLTYLLVVEIWWQQLLTCIFIFLIVYY